MTPHQRYLIEQAEILAFKPDPTGLIENVRHMACKVKIPYICLTKGGHPITDPDGADRLPVAACLNCHRYVDSALAIDPKHDDAHCRIKMGRADTYDALRLRGDIGKLNQA